ncbi:MAG: hypothetical protein JO076_16755 [Verrucomicrobia bacterium]|nr:hypothetical protein [Verrucomicrobiota bacterium]
MAIEANAGKSLANGIWLAQYFCMMFYERTAYAPGLPSAFVQEGAELQVRGTETEILDHTQTSIEYFARINGRTVGNTPIVIRVVDRLPNARRTQLTGSLDNPDEVASDESDFSGGPN